MKGYEDYDSLDALGNIEYFDKRRHWFGSRFRGYGDALISAE